MNFQIEALRSIRTSLLELLKDLSLEELNFIPQGFNNNIAWNLAHIIAAQQGVCYLRAGLPITIRQDFFELHKPNTKPERPLSVTELEEIKILLFSTLDRFEEDYNNQIFTQYPSWTTRYGVTISSIDDAVSFLPFHDGLHLGYIMALKRAVKQTLKQDTVTHS